MTAQLIERSVVCSLYINTRTAETSRITIGNAFKNTVRALAEEHGLVNSINLDQDICFVPTGDYADFLKHNVSELPGEGDYLDIEGNVIGKHEGFWKYTIGQRRGIKISLGKQVYVIDKNPIKNTVTLGGKSIYA